jgi:hypothetical protein
MNIDAYVSALDRYAWGGRGGGQQMPSPTPTPTPYEEGERGRRGA